MMETLGGIIMPTINIIKPKKKLFGNGRFFGIQTGSIEDRLDDPHCSDVDVVKYLFRKHKTILRKDKRYGIDTPETVVDRLGGKINSGNADEDLIPYIDSAIKSEVGLKSDVYKGLISIAETEASIPYLLQVLESKYEVIDKEPFELGPEVRVGTETTERSEYGCKGYESEWHDIYVMEYEKIEQEQYFYVSFPFAELAKERLEDIMEQISSLSKTLEISQAISGLGERKKKIVKETRVFRGEKLGEEYAGWR